MNGNKGDLTACFNCGTLNVTGVRSCRNCNAAQYYNCTYCHSWVDNSFSNCPNCGDKLKWPKEVYRIENTDNPDKSTSTAAIVLTLSIVLLSIITVNLMANNSNPVDAVSHTPSVVASHDLPVNELKMATQPQIHDPAAITATTSMPQTGPSASYADSYADADVNSADESISYDTIIITPLTPTSGTATGIVAPKTSSYLDTAFPTWGHCSGGSCRSYYQ